MKILTVETSGLESSVGIAEDRQILAEHVLDTAGRRHARMLVPAVDELLTKCGLQPTDVDVIAVSIGPGSFTGLRVGVVFAKTFAWINDSQLVALDTLQGLAQRAAPADCEITAISDAQRGDVFVNRYHCEVRRDAVQPSGAVTIESLESVIERLQDETPHLVTGPAVETFADQIPDSIITAARNLLSPRATALLPAACEAIEERQWANVDTLEPVYLRRSYAEEKRDAR